MEKLDHMRREIVMTNFIRIKDNEKREFSANFVFLDYENVSKAGLNDIEKLDDLWYNFIIFKT